MDSLTNIPNKISMISLKGLTDYMVRQVASKLPELSPNNIIAVLPAKTGFTYVKPANFDSLPEKSRADFNNILTAETKLPIRHLFIYKDSFVTNEGVLFKSFRVSPKSLTFLSRAKDYQDSFLLTQYIGKRIITTHHTPIAIIHNSNSTNNYYHWLIDACSRLLLLRQKFPTCWLVVPGPINEYVRATTSLLGYNNLIPVGRNEILKAPLLLLTERTSEDENSTFNYYATHQDPHLIIILRNNFLAGLEIAEKKPRRLLYISRTKQNTRRLINEPEIAQLLLSFGFETIYFENLTFAQQVSLMNDAAIVVGVHGANLTNILFMQPKTVVVELINETDINTVYFRIASYVDLVYYRLTGTPQYNIPKEQADIFVDPQSLQNIVAALL
jgi:hypothetical protein